MHLVFLPCSSRLWFATMKNKIALEITCLNVPYQRYKEQSALNMSCLHFTVIIPIFFSRLAETNSARWIFARQKKTKRPIIMRQMSGRKKMKAAALVNV